ncbi:MAG: metallophosphoesterase, partial [Dysgonamonadaceae bacterium]|nr:metallophosphoesterase [Dysgonamonadaceae bacterium]
MSLFLFLFLSFPVAMLFRYELPIPFLKFLYLPGTFWLGAIMYLLLFFGVMDIIFLVIGYRRTLFPAFAGMTGVIILLFYGYCNFSHPVVVEREISFCHPRLRGDDRIRAVAISDLHLGLNIDRKKLSEYIDLINAQKPDIVLIAGDVVDNCVRPLNEERMYEEFDRIDAPLGVYMCLGNHEYLSGIDESLDFLRKTKIHLLIDDKVLIDSCFYIVGRDDAKMGKKRKSLSELVEGIDRNFPVIVLDHQPLNLEEAEENGIDLQISGHTHNGQLFPGNLIAKAIYELSHGYMKKGKTN